VEAKSALEKERGLIADLRRRIKDHHQKGNCVYLLRNAADLRRKLWKIGMTRDLSKAECQYGTAMLDGAEIVHCRHTSDSRLVESLVHHILGDFRDEDNREWFQGEPEVFARVIDVAVNFVDGMVDVVDNVVEFNLDEKIAKLMRCARNFDSGEGNTSDGSTSSVMVNNSAGGVVNITTSSRLGT
jgi:hypothetical protein